MNVKKLIRPIIILAGVATAAVLITKTATRSGHGDESLATAKTTLKTVSEALMTHQVQFQRYPDSLDELGELSLSDDVVLQYQAEPGGFRLTAKIKDSDVSVSMDHNDVITTSLDNP